MQKGASSAQVHRVDNNPRLVGHQIGKSQLITVSLSLAYHCPKPFSFNFFENNSHCSLTMTMLHFLTVSAMLSEAVAHCCCAGVHGPAV